MLRDPVPTSVHLKDYQPPAFLIDTVDLDFDIHEDHTLVRARLAIRRNPRASDPKGPLVLDGDEIVPETIALDGRALLRGDFELDEAHLTVPGVPDAFTLETDGAHPPAGTTRS